jgi:hypothetical protein
MGRKRKITDGVIMTIYLPRELYQTLLDMAYKEKKSMELGKILPPLIVALAGFMLTFIVFYIRVWRYKPIEDRYD